MKIDQVTLYHVSMPLLERFETSSERIDNRECILLEVKANGLTGWGESVVGKDPGYSYETVQTGWHILKDFIIPSILGVEIPGPEGFDERMDFVRGHLMAKAGLEMALWDLLGLQEGRSLADLLGGQCSKVDVGVSIGIQESVAKLMHMVEYFLGKGYRRIKIKIKPGREVEEVRAIRNAYPALRLQVDANSAYTLENARVFKAMDDLDLLLIEQPLADDDLWDHHLLQAEIRTALCLDESILYLRHARQAIEMQACRVINIKPGRVGGYAQARAIHDLCRTRGLPVWCGGMLETGLGRAANLALASLPGFTLPGDISATERYYAEDVTQERFSLNSDSTIDVPRGAGVGVHMDRKALHKYSLAELTVK